MGPSGRHRVAQRFGDTGPKARRHPLRGRVQGGRGRHRHQLAHHRKGAFRRPSRDRATSLETEGVNECSHSKLAGLVVRSLERRLGEPTQRLAPDALRELTARDALAAREVHTEEQGPGVARGIEPDGALILERGDGSRVRVLAGSVRPV